jgi:glutathione synthase/RimK-type ligase-like ATP-grasp enzyme
MMEDITTQICDEIQQECVSIAKKVGLTVVGIDIITKDLSRPLKES